MLKIMEQSKDDIMVGYFKPVDIPSYETIKIHEMVHKFVEDNDMDTIESICDGFMAKSKRYSIIAVDHIVHINFYHKGFFDDDESKISDTSFQFVDIDMRKGRALFNVTCWPEKLLYLFKNMLKLLGNR